MARTDGCWSLACCGCFLVGERVTLEAIGSRKGTDPDVEGELLASSIFILFRTGGVFPVLVSGSLAVTGGEDALLGSLVCFGGEGPEGAGWCLGLSNLEVSMRPTLRGDPSGFGDGDGI